jgi:hypothetical protein
MNISDPNSLNSRNFISKSADLSTKNDLTLSRGKIVQSSKLEQQINSDTESNTKKMVNNFLQKKLSELTINCKKTLRYDPNFICSKKLFETLCPRIEKEINKSTNFDVTAFLRGPKGNSPEQLETNQKLLNQAVKFIDVQVKEISINQSMPLEKAYQQMVGVLDAYDDALAYEKSKNNQSTFLLRSAVLLSSQAAGVDLQSWMVYTKSGKPMVSKDDQSQLWPFLDNWQNWTLESQGAMAKFFETTVVKAIDLARVHSENKIVY